MSDGVESYPRATNGSGLGRARDGIPFLGQKYTVSEESEQALIFVSFYQEKERFLAFIIFINSFNINHQLITMASDNLKKAKKRVKEKKKFREHLNSFITTNAIMLGMGLFFGFFDA